MHLRILLAAAFVMGSLAGCISDDDPTPPAPVLSGQPVWVLDHEGNVLDESAFPGELPAFEQRHVTNRISGEPTVGITRTGALFYAAIDFEVGVTGVPQSLPRTVYYRSLDDGLTWEDKSPTVVGITESHRYSFDPYVYADPTTGRIYAVDMDVQASCNTVSWSDDDGKSWSAPRAGACPFPLADHPTLFAGPAQAATNTAVYPNHLYLCTNEVAQTQCSHSPDGGVTWLPSAPVSLGVNEDFGPEDADPTNDEFFQDVCSAFTGHGVADWNDGTVYVPRLFCGVPVLYRSTDGIQYETIVVSENETFYGEPGVHDSMVAVDNNGVVYYFWLCEAGAAACLVVSHDQGDTWSEKFNVTAPGVTAAKLPGIVAGKDGRIAFLYVGTTTPSGFAVHERDQGGAFVREAELRNATWNAYVGVSLDADTDAPVFALTTINDLGQPLKRGQCEDRCRGDIGGMYDFFDIEIDPITGQIYTALVDVCTGACDEPGANGDTFQQSFGAIGVQIAGTRLLDGTENDR